MSPTAFARTDRSLLGNWWWTIDRALLIGVLVLIVAGIIVVFAASPPVGASRAGDPNHFIVRHAFFTVPAVFLLVGCSLLNPLGVLRLAKGLLAIGIATMLIAILFGPELNGAQRWIRIGGQQVQPSEIVKPALVVCCAWLLAERSLLSAAPLVLSVVGIVIGLLMLQPDLGMAAVISLVTIVQLFIAGLPWLLVLGLGAIGLAGACLVYLMFPHVAARVDGFLAPPAEFTQISEALGALEAGGFWGRGPGEGIVKFKLPDAHTDFVFAATAEEFGIVACLLLVALFAFVVLRAFARVGEAQDRFVLLAAVGLTSQIAIQALINMAVNLNLVPTKGMTLPFISYGGSSMLALAIGMGWLLALTRRTARLEAAP